MALSVGSRIVLFFVISWIIIHFGKNPVNGGRPPKDNIIIRINVVVSGILFHMWDKEVVMIDVFIINTMNVVVVIRI